MGRQPSGRRRVVWPGGRGGYRGSVMLLDSIAGPRDLRDLSYAQLDELAAEIRQFIVDAVSTVGSGHLGSNLGAVELTLALHRVFDSPRDILLWDTGHQAYVHKILTGRARRVRHAAPGRRAVRLPLPGRVRARLDREQPRLHGLSYAHGLAVAQEAEGGEGRRVVAVLGDGSLTGGMAYEGLNNLGHSGKRAIIVLNDNGRSYAPTVSKLGDSLARLRANPSYLRNRARLDRILHQVPVMGHQLEKSLDGFVAAMREMFEPPAFFETLGVRYTGPFDGHDVEGLEKALRNATAYDGPIVVHVVTQKGRGYATGGERPDQAPPRHRPAQARHVHRRVHRGDDQGGRGPPGPRRHHGGHARLDRPAALRRALPRPAHRRRHRRAARGHLRRRHGDGRAAPGRRRVLHVPHTRDRPGHLRRRPARPARWCSASTAPASPATTGRRTTACSTWPCSRRCRA